MRSIVAVATALALAGCATSRHANIEGLTTDRSDQGTYHPVGQPIKRSACTSFFAFLLFGDATDHQRLVEEALKGANADVLVNAKLRTTYTGLVPLLSRHCRTVSGQPAVKVQDSHEPLSKELGRQAP